MSIDNDSQFPMPKSGSILIIDDDRSVREMMYEVLRDHGYQCLLAGGGIEAIELMEQQKETIQGAIVDLEMKGMDGIQTSRELRRINQGLRVILMSGYHKPIKVEEFLKDGLSGFLAKPFDIHILLSIINQVFQSP